MGTRHLQRVITKSGEKKISQYGQWDGYPSGQGVKILEYLRKGNLEKYQENVSKIPLLTQKQCDKINKDPDWDKKYPYLSRDCGSKIHQMIEDGVVKFINLMNEDEAEKWCEGFYTIDFNKNVFVSDYHGRVKSFSLDKLPTTKRYLKLMEHEE